jgi:hypothetical protein
MVKFMREFAYQPLDEDLGEIRLLRLLRPYLTALSYFPRGPPYVADCEFGIFAFEDARSYIAISYCWGSIYILTLYNSTVPDWPSLKVFRHISDPQLQARAKRLLDIHESTLSVSIKPRLLRGASRSSK